MTKAPANHATLNERVMRDRAAEHAESPGTGSSRIAALIAAAKALPKKPA